MIGRIGKEKTYSGAGKRILSYPIFCKELLTRMRGTQDRLARAVRVQAPGLGEAAKGGVLRGVLRGALRGVTAKGVAQYSGGARERIRSLPMERGGVFDSQL